MTNPADRVESGVGGVLLREPGARLPGRQDAAAPPPRSQAFAAAPAGVADLRRPVSLQLGMYWGTTSKSGGLDRVYTDLLRHLPAAGVTARGLVEGPAEAAGECDGAIGLYSTGPRGKLGRYAAIRRAIIGAAQHGDVDLVAIHFAFYAALALDRIRRFPTVMHFHGPWFLEAEAEGAASPAAAVKRAIERAVYRRAGRIIVLSHAFAELVTREFGVAPERVRVVPGHVDLARFTRDETRVEARERLGLPVDRPILVAVRRLKQRMGLDRLIDAVAEVAVAVPDVLLCIGGTGTLRDALEAQVRERGLGRNVRFLGYVPEDEIALLYRAADLNVVPTASLEGFGLVAAEAIAAGTPSLVTPVGGLPEVVNALSPDLVMPGCEAAEMAAHLTAALRGGLRLPGQAACENYARDRFAVDLAAARVADVYREVLA